jgi:hypothetical protein
VLILLLSPPLAYLLRCSQVNQLAMWLETSKMDPQLTGNLLGGALLGDMLQRMATAEQAVLAGSQVGYRHTMLL